MSHTLGTAIHPSVEQWLGKPVKVVESARCDICGSPSTRLQSATGWSWAAGEAVDVSVCPTCIGDGDE